jgi:hypothetical protein
MGILMDLIKNHGFPAVVELAGGKLKHDASIIRG